MMHKLPNRLDGKNIAQGCAVAALAILVGCAGHGEYTQEHIKNSQERMSQLKSGTEWQMAQQQFLAGDLDKAHKSIDKSLTLNPEVTKSHVLKGRILMEKGQLEFARQSFLEAEKIDPTYVEAQYYLGIVHERFNEPEEALQRYTNAMGLDTTNAQYVIAAGDMMVQLGTLEAAAAFLLERRSNFEYNGAIRQSLGHIAVLQQQYPKAVEYFSEALLLSPDDLTVVEDLARAQYSAQRFADAEINLGKLLANDRYADRRDIKHLQAKCMIAGDRPVEARQILVQLTSNVDGAGDVDAWVDLGSASYILADKVRLRNVASRLVALAPERHEGYMYKAMVQRMDGDMTGAVASLDLAAARTTSDSTPLLLKGMIEQDLGQTEAAKRSYAAATKIDPNGPARRAYESLGGTTTLAEHPAGED
ncbi:MAG: tetratricopeptide repeat protein [Pyrinomonadaceae bacterium]|nr:tetratricopeptide repeat protein [Phycisphaerales bacterium]